jgi:hypothetical protein
MKITVANKHCIPTNAITGRSAAELIVELTSVVKKIYVVSVKAKYKGGIPESHYPVNLNDKLYDIKIPAGTGSNLKILRLFDSWIENIRIAKAVASDTQGVIISMTDPPMLPHLMQVVARSYRRKWIYWSMDLYPQAFYTYLRSRWCGVIFKWVDRFLLRLKPDAVIALGPKQAKFLRHTYGLSCPIFIIPCGIINSCSKSIPVSEIPNWRNNATGEVYGYIGNLGEAHDHTVLYKIIATLNRCKRFVLLSVYGSKARLLLEMVKGFSYVKCVDRVSENELQYIDVHIVTLRKMWTHVCLPSKAISAVCSGAACIIAGSRDGDLYELLNEAAWWIDTESCTDSDIESLVKRISNEEMLERKRKSKHIRERLLAMRSEGYSKLRRYIESDGAF